MSPLAIVEKYLSLQTCFEGHAELFIPDSCFSWRFCNQIKLVQQFLLSWKYWTNLKCQQVWSVASENPSLLIMQKVDMPHTSFLAITMEMSRTYKSNSNPFSLGGGVIFWIKRGWLLYTSDEIHNPACQRSILFD